MRPVSAAACAFAAALAISLAARTARAAPPGSAPGPAHLELEPQVGYAAALTTGISPYGLFVGLGLRARPIGHLWVHTAAFSYGGGSEAGDGPTVTYRSRERAYAMALGASWRFAPGRFFVEPGVEVGAAWIRGFTSVTPAELRDEHVAGNVGPVLRLGVRLSGLALGIEGAGLYVPVTAAAPVLRAAAIVAISF